MNQQELLPIASQFLLQHFPEILKGHQLPSQMFIVEVGTYHQAWTFHFTHKRQLCTELQRSSQAIVFSNRIQKEWQIKERRRNLIIAHCGKIPFFVTKLQLLKSIKPSLDTWKTNWNIFEQPEPKYFVNKSFNFATVCASGIIGASWCS